MKRTFRAKEPKSLSHPADFLTQLRREMLKGELSRINVLAILCGILSTYLLIVIAFFSDTLAPQLKSRADDRLIFLVPPAFAAFIVYALLVRRSLIKAIASQRTSSTAYRYSTAAFEALFPTLLIFLLGHLIDPIYLLVSPLVILYAVFIFSATLQMDSKLPIFSSFVASTGYLAAYFWFVDHIVKDDYPAWILSVNVYAGRILFFFLCGLLSAFLASEIKRRVLGLVALTEEKNSITRMFGQHVSPQVVDKLLRQKMKLSSEMRNVCVMFLDIRNFTTFSESREPEVVVSTLNHLFTFMIDITNRHDGIINKFLGDGFMAVFGAPFSGGQDCLNAVDTSREIVVELKRANRELGENLSIGIGLHAGQVLAGDIGSIERKEYTIMGDVVNVAARIEGLNKNYDSQILISETVYDQLPDETEGLKDLGLVSVKGRKQEVRLYQVKVGVNVSDS
ncbi:MAG: adenylate/guanylate cyclase domain-containing protein [Verrucomicrobiota bacterium]